MDSFKFQVFTKDWEGIEKCFDVYFLYLLDDGTYKVAFTNSDMDKESVIVERDKLRFFTGLRDVNEKPIYEGDIVQYHRHEGVYYESKVVNKTGLVVWEHDKCSFRLKHNGGDSEKMFTSHRLEVIGNIFENPELIRR